MFMYSFTICRYLLVYDIVEGNGNGKHFSHFITNKVLPFTHLHDYMFGDNTYVPSFFLYFIYILFYCLFVIYTILETFISKEILVKWYMKCLGMF
jgi:hypothetical protein